jgi:RNA polymerase sigma-70 factor (ECF subfamily)
VQEVFARAFAPRARESYDGLRPYGGFLCGIARNIALDALRRQARRGETIAPIDALEEAGALQDDEPVRDPADTLEARRARALVAAFLEEQCDDRDRRLFALRFDRDLSQERTAEAAGLTRIQIRRWERKLKSSLLRFLKRARYLEEP